MNATTKLCLLLGLGLLIITSEGAVPKAFENLVRRNIPVGHTMSSFVQTCEGCGALFGKDYSYKCLTDKSYETFEGCFIAINTKG